MCVQEQAEFLQTGSADYGRALTGDGATILGTKFINFLVHELGKGVMIVNLKNCTERLEEVGTIDSKFIAHELMKALLAVGKETVYLVVCDGGADWVATESMVRNHHPWVHFMHCVAHEGSLILKDICKIEKIANVLLWIADAQRWFSTNKLGPLLQSFCREHYSTTRAFVNPAETRFAGKLL